MWRYRSGKSAVEIFARTAGNENNRPPTEGLQFFGALKIKGKSEVLNVSLMDLAGNKLFEVGPESQR
jgi:hypothetical protein